jgi:hypothetical protein
MATCEHLATCAQFHEHIAHLPSTSALVKRHYCDGPAANNEECARRMVMASVGLHAVPVDLYPADSPRAGAILDQANA